MKAGSKPEKQNINQYKAGNKAGKEKGGKNQEKRHKKKKKIKIFIKKKKVVKKQTFNKPKKKRKVQVLPGWSLLPCLYLSVMSWLLALSFLPSADGTSTVYRVSVSTNLKQKLDGTHNIRYIEIDYINNKKEIKKKIGNIT